MTTPKRVPNRHRVDRSQWEKWNAEQRALFNGTFEDIGRVGPGLFLHPVTHQRKLSAEEFETIRWNAAWTAAHVLVGLFTREVVTIHEGRVIAVDTVGEGEGSWPLLAGQVVA